MKKLLIIGSFVAIPMFSGTALAVCQHGDHYASEDQKYDNKGQLLADEQDPELLARLKKQQELEALEPAVVTYN